MHNLCRSEEQGIECLLLGLQANEEFCPSDVAIQARFKKLVRLKPLTFLEKVT